MKKIIGIILISTPLLATLGFVAWAAPYLFWPWFIATGMVCVGMELLEI